MTDSNSSGQSPSSLQPDSDPHRPEHQDELRPETNGWRYRLHEIIFEADTLPGVVFDILLLLLIIASIAVVCLETVPGIGRIDETIDPPVEPIYAEFLHLLSWLITICFTIEYLVRLYCVRRPSKYALSFWGIIDLMSFLPDYAFYFIGYGGSFSVIRALRLLRVFRIFKLGWFEFEAQDLSNAIWRARAKIVVFLTVVMILVTVMGSLMYEVEQWAPQGENQFTSIPVGIYWAIVTMTTVGFGDVVPVTPVGKVLSAILILIGYSLIIVPTGFVSAEIIGEKKAVSTISCASCITEGHDSDATYCKYCGDRLDTQ